MLLGLVMTTNRQPALSSAVLVLRWVVTMLPHVRSQTPMLISPHRPRALTVSSISGAMASPWTMATCSATMTRLMRARSR